MSKPKQSNKPARKKPKACKVDISLTPKEKIESVSVPLRSWKNPKYKPEMCEEVVEHYVSGMSDAQICRELYISRETFYEWVRNREDFAAAVKVGKVFSEAWWIDKAQQAVEGSIKIDSKVWFANMKNRFSWRDNPAEPKEEGGELLKSLAEMVALHKSKEREY